MHTAFLTVNLTMTLKSVVALTPLDPAGGRAAADASAVGAALVWIIAVPGRTLHESTTAHACRVSSEPLFSCINSISLCLY